MPKEEIILRLHPDGKREIETDGFTGKACTAATAKMLKAMGKVKSDKKKPVYNQSAKQQDKQEQW